MKYILYSMCLFGLSLYAADYVTPSAAGEYDEKLQCIIDIEGLCESEYVDEIFELCKDCEITTPEKVEVSDFEAWYRSVGIKFAYKCYESPLEVAAYGAVVVVGGFFIIRSLCK